jgi:hypothetical protein
MLKRLVLGSGLAMVAVSIAILPVFAYISTPGAICGVSTTTVVAGGTVIFQSHFNGGAGQTVTFSITGGGAGTTATFNPPTAVTNAAGNVQTTVTFGTGSSGTVTIVGTVTGGAQFCSEIEAVTAFPGTSYVPLGLPVPFAWMAVLLVGAALVGASVLGGRRRAGASDPDIDKAA